MTTLVEYMSMLLYIPPYALRPSVLGSTSWILQLLICFSPYSALFSCSSPSCSKTIPTVDHSGNLTSEFCNCWSSCLWLCTACWQHQCIPNTVTKFYVLVKSFTRKWQKLSYSWSCKLASIWSQAITSSMQWLPCKAPSNKLQVTIKLRFRMFRMIAKFQKHSGQFKKNRVLGIRWSKLRHS